MDMLTVPRDIVTAIGESKSAWLNVRHIASPGVRPNPPVALTVLTPQELEATSAKLVWEGYFGATEPTFATDGYRVMTAAGARLETKVVVDTTPAPGDGLPLNAQTILAYDWIRYQILNAANAAVPQATAARTFKIAAREL
jgi:hypothetical protein